MKWMLAALAAFAPSHDQCELHVWPAFTTGSEAAGWLSNLGIAGALQDYERNKDDRLRAQADLIVGLPPPRQAAALDGLNLPSELGLPGFRLIFEAKPLDVRAAERSRGRQTASDARCYAELLVTRNVYKRSPLHGQTLTTELSFRDFREARPRVRKGKQSVKLEGSEKQLDEAALVQAFSENVRAFARATRARISRR